MTDRATHILEDLPTVTAFLKRQLDGLSGDEGTIPSRPLPRSPKMRTLDEPLPVRLWALDTEHPPIAIQLYGGVTLGHNTPEATLDLSLWEAAEAGVSHTHALPRPRPDRLYVIDRESTNGTYKNGLPLSPSRAYAVENGDVLTLGRLHIGVELLETV